MPAFEVFPSLPKPLHVYESQVTPGLAMAAATVPAPSPSACPHGLSGLSGMERNVMPLKLNEKSKSCMKSAQICHVCMPLS